jgi:5-methylcytosine-specific restriction endonuclease McrA
MAFDRKKYQQQRYYKNKEAEVARRVVNNGKRNQKHREEQRAYYRERFATNAKDREYRRSAKHKRRSLTEGDLTAAQWLELVEECGGMCVICHAPYEEMDHIIPLSKGGKHTLDNVQPLCRKCNREKGAKL